VKTLGREKTFLTAEWRHLAMLNYQVDPVLLAKFKPGGTEIDCWNGRAFVSLVGFRFLKTKVCGISIPFHSNFDEVNLRFYVRRLVGGEIRRGVVFVKEIVPSWAIAAVARSVYNESYEALPMTHQVRPTGSGLSAEYGWRSNIGWNRISFSAAGDPTLPKDGSEEEFITEHFWGYSALADGATVEYRVAHPSWRVWSECNARFEGDGTDLYGPELASALVGPPSSAFLAEGSAVKVFRGQKI
jgi:uncharacterized protein YqjF (DUF2071 family)